MIYLLWKVLRPHRCQIRLTGLSSEADPWLPTQNDGKKQQSSRQAATITAAMAFARYLSTSAAHILLTCRLATSVPDFAILLQPVLTLLWGFLILNQDGHSTNQLIGMFLVLVAIASVTVYGSASTEDTESE